MPVIARSPLLTAPFLGLTDDQLAELTSVLAWLNDSPFNSVEDWPGMGWDLYSMADPDDVIQLADEAA